VFANSLEAMPTPVEEPAYAMSNIITVSLPCMSVELGGEGYLVNLTIFSEKASARLAAIQRLHDSHNHIQT
jgi:hypothetical protein